MQETAAISPSSVQIIHSGMNFYDALKAMLNGKKITRVDWKNRSIFGFFDNERLKICIKSGEIVDWIIVENDVTATDWVTID